MRVYALLTLLVLVPTLVLAEELSGPRVRALDQRVQSAIAAGIARSASFRKVLAQIEMRDVIVYVEIQPQLKSRLFGTMTWVTATSQFRYVRVALNPELSGSRLVAALAHELQHVVEVGEAPSIVDAPTMSAHYRVTGVEKSVGSEAWETEAARAMGDTVRRELATATVDTGSVVTRVEPRPIATRER